MANLKGKQVVFTGTLIHSTRAEAEAHAKKIGMVAGSKVSEKTDLLVAGTKAGSKLKAAKKYGVKVIDEAEWVRISECAVKSKVVKPKWLISQRGRVSKTLSKSRVFTFFTKIKGSVADQPDDPRDMPAALRRAEKLWRESGGKKNRDKKKLAEVFKLTASALRCCFVPGALSQGYDDLAQGDDTNGFDITVTGADFTDGCVPWICASAYFKLAFKKDIPSSEALKEWEELNDRLDNCVVFQFDGNGSNFYSGAITENDGVHLELVSIK